MSTHISAAKGDIAERILLPGDPLRARYIAERYLEDARQFNEIRNMFGYTGTYKGKQVSVMGTGMGMPSIGIYSYELISEYGVKDLIRIGTAGSFREDIALGDVVLGIAASTDSNYQHAFELNGSFSPCASWDLLIRAYEANQTVGLPLKAGNIVSCDVFYETEEDWWQRWAKMGVMAVEMEAAALYMNAACLGANALAMMTITDHFITGEKATAEEREKANGDMISLALEIAVSD